MKSKLLFSFFSAVILSPFAFSQSKKIESSLSAIDFAKQMECGWNLANSLDARDNWTKTFPLNQGLSSETVWGEIPTSEEIIKTGIECGYKTIRLPVTWCNHIIDKNYTIDPKWMARVKEIVDWAIKNGYYVILNEHHSVQDGMNIPLQHCEGYILRSQDSKESKAFLQAIWKQICSTFNNDYDQHLIFETMNEPRNAGHEHCWYPQPSICQECKADITLLTEYNQLVLDTIRASGGNNAERFVMIPGIGTSIETVLADYFKFPEDSAKDKLLLTVHLYPLDWGGTGRGSHHFDAETKKQINDKIKFLNKKFVSKGIPVVFGEYGAAKKAGTYWEDGKEKEITDFVITYQDRLDCFKYLSSLAGKYSMPLIYWDVGGEKGMATINRKECNLYEPDFVFAITKSWKESNSKKTK